MDREFLDAIEANPIIAAVKDEQGLSNCLQREELTVIFPVWRYSFYRRDRRADPSGREDCNGTY